MYEGEGRNDRRLGGDVSRILEEEMLKGDSRCRMGGEGGEKRAEAKKEDELGGKKNMLDKRHKTDLHSNLK